MKWLSISLTVIIFLLASHTVAAEEIFRYDTFITLQPDATLDIEETIVYDFGSDQRHGIFRDIPVRYKARGGNYSLKISDITVTDENGDPYIVDVSNQGLIKRIKIGDPNSFVTGKKNYLISYTVERAINYFENHDELYWNVIGNDWEVPITYASVQVFLPTLVPLADVQRECFAGPKGSTDRCRSGGDLTIRDELLQGVLYRNDRLAAGEGMTVVIGVPKGILYEPSTLRRFASRLSDNITIALPILVVLLIIYIWYTRGRDPKGRGTIIAQYEPPDQMTPSELGTIIDEHVNNYDISADIIDLAIKGYLRIHRIEKKKKSKAADYVLEKLKDGDDLPKQHRKKLMSSLFANEGKLDVNGQEINGVRLSDLKRTFRAQYIVIQDSLYESLVLDGYFLRNPKKVRVMYAGFGVIIIFIGMVLIAITGAYVGVAVLLSGLVVFIFSWYMPKRTHKGVILKEHALGLKEYITVAEKERIKFHNAPEKNPQLFEALLPYAMIFKAEKEWAQQFEGIYTHQPEWYDSPHGARFSPVLFAGSLNDFTSVASSTLSAPAQSAAGGSSGFSGGFSGGGFGGGGGGSW